jgi:hypothetical protein
MNVWKPLALCLAAGLAASVGVQVASASTNPDPRPDGVAGPCFDQIHMASAKGSLEAAIGQLSNAEHNKGGWRDVALAEANKALAATNQGCAVANGR